MGWTSRSGTDFGWLICDGTDSYYSGQLCGTPVTPISGGEKKLRKRGLYWRSFLTDGVKMQAYETVYRKDEDGEVIPWEIESIEVAGVHIDREVAICIPGQEDWTGILAGWDESGILIRRPGSPEVQCISPEFLRWVM